MISPKIASPAICNYTASRQKASVSLVLQRAIAFGHEYCGAQAGGIILVSRVALLQSEFLNAFPIRYREHIVEFAKMVEQSDAEVLIFTARKAACFFDCLEDLLIWSPKKKIVISERAKDHDLSWLCGKRVAIIDEVVVTGTNLSKLIDIVKSNNALNTNIFALFLNSDWFVDDLLKGVPVQGCVPLPSAEAQALGTAIVEAMHRVPRPYAVDYPISVWCEISERDFCRMLDSPLWRLKQTYSDACEQPARLSESVEFYSMAPEFDAADLVRSLGISPSVDMIMKVRLYGRWDVTGRSVDARVFRFRVVPYFIAAALSEEEVDSAFTKAIAEVGYQDRTAMYRSCTTHKAKLRTIQYIGAARFGRMWSATFRQSGFDLEFLIDAREIRYAFPPAIEGIVRRLGLLDSIPAPKASDRRSVTTFVTEARERTVNTTSPLFSPFLDMYGSKEIRVRKLLKKHGREIFSMERYRGLLNRLHDGLSIQSLLQLVPLNGENRREVLSDFLDLSIDHGLVVPITVHQPATKVRSAVVYRGYRHGEETYLLARDRELFRLMLETYFRAMVAKATANPNLPVGSLFSRSASPRIYVEKILVLFLRYGLRESVFSQAFNGEGVANGNIAVRVGYDLHGARLSVGRELPTQMSQENAFANWLCEVGILVREQAGGYLLGNVALIGDGPDKFRKSKATQFGLLMAEVIFALLTSDKVGRRASKRTQEALIALSTCETSTSTVLAVGAELRRAHFELSRMPLDADFRSESLLKFVRVPKGTFSYARTAVNSAYLKAKLYLSRETEKTINEIGELLEKATPMVGAVWQSAAESFKRVWGRSVVKEENHFIVDLLRLIVQLEMRVAFVEFCVLDASPERRDERDTARLQDLGKKIGITLDEVQNFSDQLQDSAHQAHKSAGQALQRVGASMRTEWQHILALRISERGEYLSSAMADSLTKAYGTYSRIDATYNARGQIAPVRVYRNLLVIDIFDISMRIAAQAVLDRSFEKAAHSAPRAYDKPQGGDRHALLTFRITEPTQTSAQLSVFASGPGAASWLGYVAGEVVKLFRDAIDGVRVSAMLGLDESRSVICGAHDGNLDVPPCVDEIVSCQRSLLTSSDAFVAVQSFTAERTSIDTFMHEFEDVLKTSVTRKNESMLIASDALGTELSTRIVKATSMRQSRKVVFLFAVKDELQVYLRYLADAGHSVRKQAPHEREKFAWHADINGESGDFEVVAVLNREVGSHDASAVLSHVCDVYSPFMIVVVGIAASLRGDGSRMREVVVPFRVMDSTQSVAGGNGESPRSFDRPFPTREREIIQAFFVEKTSKDKLLPHKFGTFKESVREDFMQTDNALLRTSNPNDLRRKAASEHSDKITSYEMEAAGVVAFLENKPKGPYTFIVKGLSDLGDEHKADNDDRYLAGRNAVVVALVLTDYVLGIYPQTSTNLITAPVAASND